MNTLFHKRAIAAAASLLTLTSAVTSVSAAQKNEIAIETDRDSVSGGESFNLTVQFKPDSTGACGFTVDLHFDPEAVSLKKPDESSYKVGGEFTVVTNFDYDNDTIRITGADLSGSNVQTDTDIAYLTFTVNDGYEGDIAFWTDVETLVYSSGTEFYNADYTQNGASDPYIVTAEEEKQPEVTVSEVDSYDVTETTTLPETEAETETTAETSLPDVVIPVTTVIPDDPDDTYGYESETETEAVTTETYSYDEPDTEEYDDLDGWLFRHDQDGYDYTNDEALQYTFSPYDFIGDYGYYGTVDITVGIYSTDTVVGGIGMQTSDGWTVFNSDQSAGVTQWTAEGVDLSDVYGNIAVQVYYLKHDSTFAISSITVTPVDSWESVPVDSSEPEDSNTDDTSYEEPDYEDSSYDEPAYDEPTVDGDTYSSEAEVETAVSEADSFSGEDSSAAETPTDTVPDSDSSETAESTAAEDSSQPDVSSSAGDSSSETVTSGTGSADTDSKTVETAVDTAKKDADSNPNTGKKLGLEYYFAGGLVLLSIGQICYSLYSLSKLNKRNK